MDWSSTQRRLQRTFLIADPVLVAGLLEVSLAAHPGTVAHADAFHLIALGLLPATLAVFTVAGAYTHEALAACGTAVSRALGAAMGVIGLLLLTVYLLKYGEGLSRLVVLGWIGGCVLALPWLRWVGFALARRGHGRNHRVVLAGQGEPCLAFARHLDANPGTGLGVAAICADDLAPADAGTLPIAPLAELERLIDQADADRVVVCTAMHRQALVAEVLQRLLPSAIPVTMALDLDGLPVFCLRGGDIAGRPVLSLTEHPLGGGRLVVKEIEDRVLGALLLLLFSPLMLAIAVAVRLASPGPVLFVQERHGLGGRPIRVLKFRTMYAAAPPPAGGAAPPGRTPSRILQMGTPPTPPELRGVDGEFRQATPDDPRIFPLGRWLRRLSLDELPQLLNVVRGDMSLVGPRPHAIEHNQAFAGDIAELMRRHFVKPGITGLAQISGSRGETRSVGDMARRVALDLDYIRRWSLLLDLRILALTAWRGFVNRQP